MPNDEEIRSLCLTVLQSENDKEFESAIGKLRTALNDHTLETENLAVHMILNRPKVA